ncbi:MAG: TRAP transporter small permease [Saprospiraceae bacterium]
MKDTINKYLGYFLIALMSLMTIDVLWGVFTRYAIGAQASWSEELARFLLIWIGILGAAYASGQKMHLAIELLKPSLDKKNQERLSIFINLLIAFFALTVMVIGGSRLIYITKVLGQISPALQVPMYVVYAVIPLSGLLIIYYKLTDIKSA